MAEMGNIDLLEMGMDENSPKGSGNTGGSPEDATKGDVEYTYDDDGNVTGAITRQARGLDPMLEESFSGDDGEPETELE